MICYYSPNKICLIPSSQYYNHISLESNQITLQISLSSVAKSNSNLPTPDASHSKIQ